MSRDLYRTPSLRTLVFALGLAVALWFTASCTVETTLQAGGPAEATALPAAPSAEPSAAPTPIPTAVPTAVPTAAPTATSAPSPTPEPEPTSAPDVGQVLGGTLEQIRAVADLPPGTSVYDEFVDLTDDDDLIFVTVPADWADTDGRSWNYDDALIGPALSASPDLEAFVSAWGTPGLFLAASDQLSDFTVEEFLDEFWFGDDCTYEGRYDYNDGLYVGLFDAYVKCGPEDSAFLQLIAAPADGSYLIEAQFLIASDADWLAVERAINTFTASVGDS